MHLQCCLSSSYFPVLLVCQYTEIVVVWSAVEIVVVGFPCFQLEGSFHSISHIGESQKLKNVNTVPRIKIAITLISALLYSLASYLVACWPLT